LDRSSLRSLRAIQQSNQEDNMTTIKNAALPSMFIAAAALLGGCIGAEPGEGDEALDAPSEVPAELSEPEQMEAQVGPEQTAESASALTAWFCVTGACAQFEAYGEHLYVRDTLADGHSAVGQISGYGTCWNHSGAGTTIDCNFDTAESTIYFRACTGEYSTRQILTCTPWIQTSAAN
jgi:hypothetical protein